MDKDSLAHSKWNCKYHIVFAMVFSITHCCVNFIKASCYSIHSFEKVVKEGLALLCLST